MGQGDTDGDLVLGLSNLCLVRLEAALPAQQLVNLHLGQQNREVHTFTSPAPRLQVVFVSLLDR